MIRGVIFDLDGTLLDSMPFWNALGETYLRSLGLVPQPEFRNAVKTLTLPEAIDYVKTQYSLSLSKEEIADGIRKLAADFYENRVQLKPGAAAFLQKMQETGIKMCIATAADNTLAEGALRRLGVWKYFCALLSCHAEGLSKRDGAIYEKALAYLGTEKGETAVFEDALHAAASAKGAGFYTVGVYDASEENQTALRETADLYMESLLGAEAFFERSKRI